MSGLAVCRMEIPSAIPADLGNVNIANPHIRKDPESHKCGNNYNQGEYMYWSRRNINEAYHVLTAEIK